MLSAQIEGTQDTDLLEVEVSGEAPIDADAEEIVSSYSERSRVLPSTTRGAPVGLPGTTAVSRAPRPAPLPWSSGVGRKPGQTQVVPQAGMPYA